MLQPGKWELAVRFQDYDNATDTVDSRTLLDVAINNYIDGHGLKWMVNMQTDDDGESLTSDTELTIGIQASF